MLTGQIRSEYPSVNKPWLKYYREESVNSQMPSGNMYNYIFQNNKMHLNDTALVYFGKKISCGKLFQLIDRAAEAFQAISVKAGDVVSFVSITTPDRKIKSNFRITRYFGSIKI